MLEEILTKQLQGIIHTAGTRISRYDTAKKIAELTGYSRERIRQLTYKTSSDSGMKFPLKEFLEGVYSKNGSKRKHYVYKKEAINYLLNRKNKMKTQTEEIKIIRIPVSLHKELKKLAKKEGKKLERISIEILSGGIKAKQLQEQSPTY